MKRIYANWSLWFFGPQRLRRPSASQLGTFGASNSFPLQPSSPQSCLLDPRLCTVMVATVLTHRIYIDNALCVFSDYNTLSARDILANNKLVTVAVFYYVLQLFEHSTHRDGDRFECHGQSSALYRPHSQLLMDMC